MAGTRKPLPKFEEWAVNKLQEKRTGVRAESPSKLDCGKNTVKPKLGTRKPLPKFGGWDDNTVKPKLGTRKPLPKFGEWDVNKLQEKRTGVRAESPPKLDSNNKRGKNTVKPKLRYIPHTSIPPSIRTSPYVWSVRRRPQVRLRRRRASRVATCTTSLAVPTSDVDEPPEHSACIRTYARLSIDSQVGIVGAVFTILSAYLEPSAPKGDPMAGYIIGFLTCAGAISVLGLFRRRTIFSYLDAFFWAIHYAMRIHAYFVTYDWG